MKSSCSVPQKLELKCQWVSLCGSCAISRSLVKAHLHGIFAERSGIPQSTISAIENGRVNLDINLGIERAKMLARALQCHPSVLVFPGWEVPLKLAA